MPGVVLDMAVLGSDELARNDLVRALRPIAAGYRAWLDRQATREGTQPEIAWFGAAAGQMIADARGLADRLDCAVDLLGDDPLARDAFRFANRAMAAQRVRTEVARIRLADPRRGELRLQDYANDWFEQRRRADGRQLAPRTKEIYRSLLDRFILPGLGGRQLTALRTEDIRWWHGDVTDRSGRCRQPSRTGCSG
jgi:hypothetical protein